MGYFHHQGCCQLPPDLDRVTETLISLGKSPNVTAVLVVSLGCEGTDHEWLTAEIRKTEKPVRIIRIQELGGVSAAIKGTPGREPEILTGMAATGAQFMMFSTGRGRPRRAAGLSYHARPESVRQPPTPTSGCRTIWTSTPAVSSPAKRASRR